jgi:hypothetical protein
MTPRPPLEENAMIGTKPYAKLKYREVKDAIDCLT